MQHESIEQQHLFEWAAFMSGKYPDLEWMFHIPNGGRRDKIEAAHLKAQGVKAGVPDICLPVPRGKYHGLYIELKYGENKPTAAQLKWLKALNRRGYAALTCWGWEQASRIILDYLRQDDNTEKENSYEDQ